MENEKDKNTLKEEISNIGKIIVGELESIGGVLTADGNARAEGDLIADEGIIREKIAHDLAKEEKTEE
ncbi:MAG TPA: hypothetical protein PKY82_11880 [Pyrinomonadaceae bacterium]|nr:hypothetical protein [Pyrinomonadaceae bacterium]